MNYGRLMVVMMNPRETWTDQRLDEFKENVNQRFDAVDKRFDAVDKRFDRVEAEIRELRRMMFQGFVAQTTITVSCFIGLAGLFAF
jgi:hypothetical protein